MYSITHSPELIPLCLSGSLVAAILKCAESITLLVYSIFGWLQVTAIYGVSHVNDYYQFKAWKKSIYIVSYHFFLLTKIPDLSGKILFQLRNSQLTISRKVHLTTFNVRDNQIHVWKGWPTFCLYFKLMIWIGLQLFFYSHKFNFTII